MGLDMLKIILLHGIRDDCLDMLKILLNYEKGIPRDLPGTTNGTNEIN